MKTKANPAQVLFSNPAFQAGYQAAQSVASTLAEPETTSDADQVIEAALKAYYSANEAIKPLNREKAKAKKLLKGVSAGEYGNYRLLLTPNSDREELDMERIAAVFAAIGEEIPYIANSIEPSLYVEEV